MDKDDRTLLLGGLFLVFILFCITDCSCGKKRYCPGEVTQHVYKPPYTTVSCSSDKHGTHCHTDYHPAEYRLLVVCQWPNHVARINAGETDYARLSDGDRVLVGERIGRWSK